MPTSIFVEEQVVIVLNIMLSLVKIDLLQLWKTSRALIYRVDSVCAHISLPWTSLVRSLLGLFNFGQLFLETLSIRIIQGSLFEEMLESLLAIL